MCKIIHKYLYLSNTTIVIFSRLSESPFKVHVEKLTLEQRKTDGDQQLYLIPLEIKLKHSTVHVAESCPLLVAKPGVAAIHDYADWVRDSSGDSDEVEREYQVTYFKRSIEFKL